MFIARQKLVLIICLFIRLLFILMIKKQELVKVQIKNQLKKMLQEEES